MAHSKMRADLLALTPEALAVLANMGLVKRAQKEIAAGQGPSVGEEPDGTVVGTFADGVRSTLTPGKALKDTLCSCGATSVCRHRIATVLVYLQDGESTGPSEPTQGATDRPVDLASPTGAPLSREAATSFGATASAEAAASTGETASAQAAAPSPLETASIPDESGAEEELKAYLGRRIYDKALKLRGRTTARVESEGLVHLDTCSVRFLSGQRLEFARCDCRAAGPCEHLALALWALRGTLASAPAPELSLAPIENALSLVAEVIAHGVSHLGQGLGTRFEEARKELLRARMIWPHELLEEMEAELGYYQNRGGRYRASRLAHCACSLWARYQASRHDPRRATSALGLNQAPETSLRQLRLTGLGCRLEKEQTQYYLADSTSGTVLVLELGTGYRPSGLTPQGLAGGQFVTAAAHRRANGMLRLGRGPHSLSSCGSWDHLAKLYGAPPARDELLGECHAAPAIRVLPVDTVHGAYYSPGQQELSLMVQSGELIARVALAHRGATPFALECLWSSNQGLTAVAGVMEREGCGWLMRPTALLRGKEVLVPDLAKEGSMEDVPLGQRAPIEDPLAGAIDAARACWHDVLHRGPGLNSERLATAAAALRRVGLDRSAAQLENARAPEDWLRLATRLEIAGTLLYDGSYARVTG